MPLVQRLNGTSNAPRLALKKKDTDTDQRVSVCTDCERGIFKFHTYKWTSRGLVHIDCKNVTAEVLGETTVDS